MKKEKIGLTPLNWFLSIIGILIFASFIVLPPVFRTVFEKEEVVVKPEEKIVIKNLICTRNNYVVNNHTENNVVEISYYKDTLTTYKKRTEQTFRNTVAYEEEKQKQALLTTAYSLLDGISYDYSKKDSDLKIIIVENYDVETFKPEDVNLPDSEEPIKIEPAYEVGDTATNIINDLKNSEYICE